MHRNPILLSLIILFVSVNFSAQAQVVDIDPPLRIPLLLSGNFGELRSTHFHAGIDIKTNKETGKAVYSPFDGYVSRFKVQSGGYGHAVYIAHDNGYTTVYGHLQEFFPELEAYLKEQQYKKKSFEVDIYPSKDKFPIKKGQLIALSGNTGRSGGPHLHFELRNGNQVPQNVLKCNLPVKDTIAPKFRRLAVYDGLNEQTYYSSNKKFFNLIKVNSDYKINQTIKVGEKVAFGAEVYDFLNGSNNKCGVYRLQLLVDDVLLYAFTIDQISFSETRYIKSHLDYAEKKTTSKNVHRLLREPYNKLSIYDKVVENGIVSVTDSLIHSAKIIASDVYGNESTLSFNFQYSNEQIHKKADSGDVFINYREGINFNNEFVTFSIAPNGLFSNSWMSYSKQAGTEDYFSDIHTIGDRLIPVTAYPRLKIKQTSTNGGISPEKLIIASVNEKGRLSSEGGVWKDSVVSAKVTGFGSYVIVADTVPPVIKAYSFKKGGWYGPNDRISFKISDNLSGIKTYNGYIDGHWALFEYDSKSSTLFYRIDANKLERVKTPHNLEIFVLDERNNMQKFAATFYY